jgi:hypothetical protein
MKLTVEQLVVIAKISECEKSSELEKLLKDYDKVFNRPPRPDPKREVEINGVKMPFDYTSPGNLDDLKRFYDNCDYIGSGQKAWYDENECDWSRAHHFFRKQQPAENPPSGEVRG